MARRWAPLLVVSVVIAGLAGFLISNTQPRVYESRALLIVGQSLSGADPDYNQLLVSQRLSATYATVATTRPILERVIATVGLEQTPAQLARNVQAVATPDNALLSIVARDGDPVRAAAIANALATELVEVSPAVAGGEEAELREIVEADMRAIRQQIETTQATIDELAAKTDRTPDEEAQLQTLQDRANDLRSTYANLLAFGRNSAANLLTTVESAVAPLDPVAPRPLFTAVLAAVLGLLVGSLIAFSAEYLDDTIKTPDEVEASVGLATLGSIGLMKGGRGRAAMYRLAALLYPRSAMAEGYRTIRTNIEFASLDAPIRTLLVTSFRPSEGKSVTAANLAITFAQAGRRVLLVDADLRRATLDSLFRVPNDRGLTTLLRDDTLSINAVAHQTEQDGLVLLTTGPLPPNPADLLGSQRMRALAGRIADLCDIAIFDSPPLNVVADAAVVSSYLDATLLVVLAGRTRAADANRGREILGRADATVLGVVLNGTNAAEQGGYGYDPAPSAPARDAESGRAT